MSKERVQSLLIMCATLVVLSVLGLASAFMTGLVFSVDGLLLVMICLMMAGIFLLMLYFIASDQGWLPSPGKKKAAEAAVAAPPARSAAPAKAPVAADAGQPNQATHPVDQTASRPQMQPGPAKAGEGK